MGGSGSSSGKGGGGGAAGVKGTSFQFINSRTGKSATATIESNDLDFRMTKSRYVLSKDEYIKNYGGSVGTMESTGSLESPSGTMTRSMIRQSSKGNYYRIDETYNNRKTAYNGAYTTNVRIRKVTLR